MTKENDEDLARKVMSVPDVAKALGISRNSAYEAVARREIPVIKIGRRLLVPRAAFERMLEGRPE
jgi:excisionase family DNA binding protein